MYRTYLGINSVYHESSACLIIDNKIIAAIEEERLIRIKHAKKAKIDNPDELPMLAIEKCLEMGSITMKDVDAIGYCFEPKRRLKNIDVDDAFHSGDWGSEKGELLFYNKLLSIPEKFKAIGFNGKFEFIEHAITHAASSFYPSGFEDAAILSMDGIGEIESTTLAYGRDKHIENLIQINYPHSLGFLWEKISKFLGYTEYDACKVMSVASFGNPKRFRSEFKKIISLETDNFFEINKEIMCFQN